MNKLDVLQFVSMALSDFNGNALILSRTDNASQETLRKCYDFLSKSAYKDRFALQDNAIVNTATGAVFTFKAK